MTESHTNSAITLTPHMYVSVQNPGPVCLVLTVDGPPPFGKKPRLYPYHKPLWARFLAVAICVQCCIHEQSSDAQWRTALETFKQQHDEWEKRCGKDLPPCGIPRHLREFMSKWYRMFKGGNHTCEDAERAGRPRLIPPLVAKNAAAIVKKGQLVKVKHGRHTCDQLVYYPTIQDAIEANSDLQQILKDYKVSADQLRAAMRDADEALVRRRVTFKRVLSTSQKAARVKAAVELLRRLASDPNFLQNIVFIDETTIVLFGEDPKAVHVWCDKNDVHFHDVCPIPEHAKHPTVKVHLVAAVTSHPAFKDTNGLVYVEMTTGTTDIQRRTNKRLDGSSASPNFQYLVSSHQSLNTLMPAKP